MLKTETIFKKLLKISIIEWGQVFENISNDTYFRTSFVKYSFTFVNINFQFTIIFNRIHPKIQFRFSKSLSWIKVCKNENVEKSMFGMHRVLKLFQNFGKFQDSREY